MSIRGRGVGRLREYPPVLIRCLLTMVALAIVEDGLEHPAHSVELIATDGDVRLPKTRRSDIEQQRLPIAVSDSLRIPVGGTHAVAFIGLASVNAGVVLGHVVVDDRVASVIVALADEPA